MTPPANSRPLRYHFGAHELSEATRELRRGGQLIQTTPKIFDLLSLLLAQRHRVVPHDELIAAVWARAHISPSVLPQMVHKLRQVLDLPGQRASWIKGVRGVGYRFAGRVEVQDDHAGTPPSGAGPVQAAETLPLAAADLRLYELGREQIRRDDLDGLGRTIAELRSPADGGGTRRCLVWADIFDSHRERLGGNSKTAWHHLRSAQLMMEGLDDAQVRAEFHSIRGLYFESFTNEAEALAEFEVAWSLANQVRDARLMAGCAARLAYAFARSRNWRAFEEWSGRSLQLAAECGSRALYLRHSVGVAISWQEMGNGLAQAGDLAEARLAWDKALRMNEAVLNEPATGDVTERTRRIARINALDALAQLRPDRVDEALAGLLDCLADETRPAGRAQLHGLLAGLLRQRGGAADLPAASEHCRQALAVCDAFNLSDQRDVVLDLAATVASAQGDHASASRWLRELLKWRSEQSARQAERVAAITAVRLETERVLALAQAEREKARMLGLENQALRQRAALLESLSGSDPDTGLLQPAQFERHLAAAWHEATQRDLPLCVALLAADPGPSTGAGAASAASPRGLAKQLLHVCRDGDAVAGLDTEGQFAIVLQGVGLSRARAVCERLLQLLQAQTPPLPVSLALADVAPWPEASALPMLRNALAAAQAAGGNRIILAGAGVIKK
jgi:DNA-binding winged helix-turn-helix (wHTH) protein/GGDEF domain-containing protein